MPTEHNRPNGLGQGYYCNTCGAPGLSMMGNSQHGSGKCVANLELVEQLDRLNGHAPHVTTATFKGKLGNKLAATVAALEAANINKLDAQAAADLDAVRKEREELKQFVDGFRHYLIDTITAEKVPAKKIKDYHRMSWIRNAMKGTAAHKDIWNDLRNWAREQALDIVASEDHDGMGMANWITLTAVAKIS